MEREKLTEFYEHVAQGNLEEVKKLLPMVYSKVSSKSTNSAIINGAGIFGRNNIINFILNENKNLIFSTDSIRNALSADNFETFKILVKHIEEVNGNKFDYTSSLIDTCTDGQIKFVEYFIKEKLVDIHYEEEKALTQACKNGHLDIVKLLIKNGANPYISSYKPYVSALRAKHFEIVKYIRSLKSKTVKIYEEA